MTSSSRALSKQAESDWPSAIRGHSFFRSCPSSVEFMEWRRAAIQLTFPRRVLISPLWAIIRNGWARSQDGKVLVEKRWCTSASAVSIRGSFRST